MNRLPFKLTLPRTMYEAIGHMLCQWAHLEQAMNDSIFELGKYTTDDEQRKIGAQQFKTRLGRWQTLIAPHVKHRFRRGALTVFAIRSQHLKTKEMKLPTAIGESTKVAQLFSSSSVRCWSI